MFTPEQGKLLNDECAAAYRSAWEKVRPSNLGIHAQLIHEQLQDCSPILAIHQHAWG
jgi:hypothetical protein